MSACHRIEYMGIIILIDVLIDIDRDSLLEVKYIYFMHWKLYIATLCDP